MEIQDEDFQRFNGSIDFEDEEIFNWNKPNTEQISKERFSGGYSVLRQSLVSSPIVKKLYRFKYSLNKKLEGLAAESFEDDGSILTKKMMRELRQPNPDSFDMDIDDDLESEMLRYTTTDRNVQGAENIEVDLTEEYKPELQEIIVAIRHTSILIDNEYEVKLPSTVRSCDVLRGSQLEDNVWDEDSLLITLASGYLLLIRFFHVDNTAKPYVVQWWKTSSFVKHLPTLSDVGRETLAHSSGNLIALTSAQGCIRLHHCTQTPHGVILDLHQNINFDGTILHTCFLEPLKDVSEKDHALIFSLMVTSHRRYMIRLFEFWLEEKHIMEHSPFLLTNEFDVPVFVFPFQQSAFLMMENKIVVISVNQILSVDYNFLTADFDGAFPTGYYKPVTPITSDNEVLISTEDGTIYSVIVLSDRIHVKPILKAPKLSHFILEKVTDGYGLYYTCSFGSGGYTVYPELLSDEVDFKNLHANRERAQRFNNWAPLLDVELVDTRSNSQELWLAHGKSLSRIRKGYAANREIQDPKLRKAHKVYCHAFDDDIYFIFSFVDKTLVYRYEDDQLIDVEDSGLDLINRTISVSSLGSVCFQVLENSLVVTDFASDHTMRKEFEKEVLLADSMDLFTAIITEDFSLDGEVRNFLTVFESSGDIHNFGHQIQLDLTVSFVKFLEINETIYLVVAAPGVLKVFRKDTTSFIHLKDFPIEFQEPHDVSIIKDIILISSRFGEVASFETKSSIDGLDLAYKYTLKISQSPIELYATDEEVLLISKELWRLNHKEKYPVPVIFDDQKDRTVFSVIVLNSQSYAVLRDDCFCFVSVSKHQEPVLKSIKLSQVPKKIKYLSHLGVFAIISENSLEFTSKVSRLESRIYTKRKSPLLFDDESPLSLSEWIFPTNDKAFRNILIGCNSSTGGSIKVLQPKLLNDGSDIIEAHQIYTAKTDGPVLAFEQLDAKTVIYSSGLKLMVSSYDLESKNFLDSVIVHEFNSLIMGIDVQKDLVLVSTKDYSVAKFKVVGGTLEMSDNDFSVRKVTNSLVLTEHVAITTDKLHCSITGLENQETKFKSYVPFVPKLVRCNFKPLWYTGDISNRFIAYGIGGEIQLYTILDKNSELRDNNNYQKRAPPNLVTQKGLWDLNNELWVSDRDANVVDGDRLLATCATDSVTDLLHAVAL